MDTELFNGLDSLIFNQPDSIDVSTFTDKDSKTKDLPENTEELVDNFEDKKDSKSKGKNKTEDNSIDPSDFFKKAKEDAEEELKDTTPEDKSDDKEDSSENVVKNWAEYFKENSLLMEDDLKSFDGSMDSLVSAFQEREKRVGLEMVEDYKSQLPDELKFLADNWEEGVPLKELIDIRSNKIKYSLIKEDVLEESVDTQKAVYKEYLRKTTKMSDTKIDKEVERLVDLDELKDEAKDVLKELKKFEDEAEDTLRKETKKEQELRKVENAKTIKAYEKTVSDTKEVVPGLKLDEKLQKDILNKIINPIGIDGNGNPVSYIASVRNEDPYKFDMAITYLATLTTDKEGKAFSDWSKIVKVGETKAIKSLEDKLTNTAPKSVKDGIKTTGKQSLLDLLEKNKGIFGK
jgi:hypothetical protein